MTKQSIESIMMTFINLDTFFIYFVEVFNGKAEKTILNRIWKWMESSHLEQVFNWRNAQIRKTVRQTAVALHRFS